VPPEALEAAFSSSYGIYGGSVVHRAELRFSPRAARWVAREEWHPNQIGTFDSEGHYRLTLPYADPTELVMDILRHGHHVEVLAPEALRVQVRDEIARMARHYST
jgi:predicted DNA-binding transcriptional regulator YafY